jgi:hypothetical protein
MLGLQPVPHVYIRHAAQSGACGVNQQRCSQTRLHINNGQLLQSAAINACGSNNDQLLSTHQPAPIAQRTPGRCHMTTFPESRMEHQTGIMISVTKAVCQTTQTHHHQHPFSAHTTSTIADEDLRPMSNQTCIINCSCDMQHYTELHAAPTCTTSA